MSEPTDYQQIIQGFQRQDLLELWTRIQEQTTEPEWPGGRALEYLVLRAFEIEGADVVWPYEVRHETDVIEQIDGAVYWHNLSCWIEAKNYGSNVDFAPVAKLRSQLLRRPPSVFGVVFSSSQFTEPARILTRYSGPPTVLLWNGDEISFALENDRMCSGLTAKYRHAIEHAIPDYHLLLGARGI